MGHHQEQAARRLGPGDLLLPLLMAVVAVVEVLLADVTGTALALTVELAACAVLVVRRPAPLLAAPVAVLLTAAPFSYADSGDVLATGVLVWVVAMYALGRWAEERWGAVVFVLTYGAVAATIVGAEGLDDAVWGLVIFLPPYLMARLVRRLADHNALLERERLLVEHEAKRAERDRIARELHDVIAHSISAMVVQSAAGRDLVRRDPQRAREVLTGVADLGRRAIGESDRLLHVIGDDAAPGRVPTRDLRDLPELVAEFREQGLRVEVVADPVPTATPAAVGVSAYRIAREALTNALRYASDRSVRLEVWASSGAVTIRAVNRTDGRTGSGTGLGLVGLRERVELLRGELRHGPTAAGEFELIATLPLDAEPTP